jgi:hypothetical protein
MLFVAIIFLLEGRMGGGNEKTGRQGRAPRKHSAYRTIHGPSSRVGREKSNRIDHVGGGKDGFIPRAVDLREFGLGIKYIIAFLPSLNY